MSDKIAITGHTSGIGKAIFESFAPNSLGFSRSNGYNIADPDQRNQILFAVAGCDVFVNNAYEPQGQIDLLYGMAELWRNTDKLIINIGSISPDSIARIPHPYSAYKAALDRASQQLCRLPGACRITNLRLGWVDTPRVQDIKTDTKLDTQVAVDEVRRLIELPKHYQLESQTLFMRKVNNTQ